MVVDIHFNNDRGFSVENLKEIKAFNRQNPKQDPIIIKPEDFCFSEYCQYHFVGDTTAIVSGTLISWVVFR